MSKLFTNLYFGVHRFLSNVARPHFHNVVLFETNNDIMLYFIYLSARTEKEKKEIMIASTSKNKAYYILQCEVKKGVNF